MTSTKSSRPTMPCSISNHLEPLAMAVLFLFLKKFPHFLISEAEIRPVRKARKYSAFEKRIPKGPQENPCMTSLFRFQKLNSVFGTNLLLYVCGQEIRSQGCRVMVSDQNRFRTRSTEHDAAGIGSAAAAEWRLSLRLFSFVLGSVDKPSIRRNQKEGFPDGTWRPLRL